MKTVHNYCHVERRADVAGVVQVERPPATRREAAGDRPAARHTSPRRRHHAQ